MRAAMLTTSVLVLTAYAVTITVGSPDTSGPMPLDPCGDPIHYQGLVLTEEIGVSVEIHSLSFMVSYVGGSTTKENATFYMALTELDELTNTFSNNYTPGTRIEVAHLDTLDLSGAIGEWVTIEFDTPFGYPGSQNLLIEMVAVGYGCYSEVYNWDSNANRSLYYYDVSSPTGWFSEFVPYMMLEGDLCLTPGTFGMIKVEIGNRGY